MGFFQISTKSLKRAIFYNITSEFISFFYQGSFKFEHILYVLIYFGQSVLIYFFIQFICKENITQKQINLIWCLYFCVMLILLFGRQYIGLAINLNPLTIFELNYYSFFQNFFNLVLFIPIGFIFNALFKEIVDSTQKRTVKTEIVSMIYL